MTKFAILFCLAATSAQAQVQQLCAPRSIVVFNLERDFGEVRQRVDFVDETSVMEIWASEKTGTWTRFKTYTNGTSCLVDEGKGWGMKS